MPFIRKNEKLTMYCPKCKKTRAVLCNTWESSDEAHVDYNYACETCNHMWWIDGIDS